MIKRQKGCNDIYGREAKVWKYVDTVVDALMEKYNYNYMNYLDYFLDSHGHSY